MCRSKDDELIIKESRDIIKKINNLKMSPNFNDFMGQDQADGSENESETKEVYKIKKSKSLKDPSQALSPKKMPTMEIRAQRSAT